MADEKDANRTSLRRHLLFTEQILGLLFDLLNKELMPKHLDGWLKTKKVQTCIIEHVKPIPDLAVTIRPRQKLTVSNTLRHFLEYAHRNNYTDDKIAQELGVTVQEVRILRDEAGN